MFECCLSHALLIDLGLDLSEQANASLINRSDLFKRYDGKHKEQQKLSPNSPHA